MANDSVIPRTGELRSILDEKLTALMREMQDANWAAEEVAFALQAVLKERWIDQAMALRAARSNVPEDFVSDGNEG